MKRFSINVTPKQAETLEQYAKYNNISLNKTVCQMLDIACDNLVREVVIHTGKLTKRIVLKDSNVYFTKKYLDDGDYWDNPSLFEIGLTVEEVVNWLECKNCGYKQYLILFEDIEIPIDDIVQFSIETMGGGKLCY